MSIYNWGRIHPLLRPRNGITIRVLGVARISSDHQDEKSLADQEELYRAFLSANLDGPFELVMISTRGKGERTDRIELTWLFDAVASREFDLVLCEDLGRIIRRVHAVLVCEECEDSETRLIAINDNVDTGKEDWRVNTFFASLRHEQYNKDTANRVRRSLRNRFMQGGMIKTLPFGYTKPPGATHDSQVFKTPEHIPIVEEMIRQLEEGRYYSEVADWLNSKGIPVGKGSRSKRWTPQLVRYTIMNPIFKGVRRHNDKITKRINKSGRRISVKAPPEMLLERHVPHLAFMAMDRYDRLIERLKNRNAKYTVAKRGQKDPRKNKPKKRTRWPGQQITCRVCGNMFVFGAHGQKTHMMCNGASRYECWNGITFDAELAVPRMAQAVFEMIAALPDFDAELRGVLQHEIQELLAGQDARQAEICGQAEKIDKEIANLITAIGHTGHSDALLVALKRMETEKRNLSIELEAMSKEQTPSFDLPPITELRRQALDSFKELALESFEFARQIKSIVPRIEAYPVRILDGGDVAIRAKLTISLAHLIPVLQRSPSVIAHLQREIIVDLFNMPQRAAYRERVLEARKTMTEAKAASKLGLTITAAQRAAVLDRIMHKHGANDPYVELMAPPPELTRHLHPRYCFRPAA